MRKTLKIVSAAVQVAVLLLVVILLGPRLLGMHQYTVLSGSMEPALPVGSMIVVRPVEMSALEVGDVITYSAGGDLVTHRIVAIGEEGATTRGDANSANDANPVTGDRLVGRLVFHIPLLGHLSLFVSRIGPVPIICALAALYLLLGVVPRLVGKEENTPREDA